MFMASAVVRTFVEYGPELAQRLHGFEELMHVHRFDHVGIDPRSQLTAKSRSSREDDRITTGTCLRCSSVRMRLSTSRPSMRGILMSSSTSDGLPVSRSAY